jgi:hypothetical protein
MEVAGRGVKPTASSHNFLRLFYVENGVRSIIYGLTKTSTLESWVMPLMRVSSW